MMKPRSHRKPRRKYRTKKPPPPEKTFLETKYILYLVKHKTPLRIKLKTNQEVQGYIQYYDKDFIRVTCPDGERLFIFKHDIKYFYEDRPGA